MILLIIIYLLIAIFGIISNISINNKEILLVSISVIITVIFLYTLNNIYSMNKYSCINNKCVIDGRGIYTLDECKNVCNKDPPSPSNIPTINLKYLTIEYNPITYESIDSISEWFNESIIDMKEGDVGVFMTDYMIIHDNIKENMRTAIQKGAKFILGCDRWYVCGKPYSCTESNTCPDCSGTDKNDKTICNCNLASVGGCNSFNDILNYLDYCNNKDSIILLDIATNDNSELWGHAHRKIINFYYKSTNKANILIGSWNIDADLNRKNLGVKETSMGINCDISSSFCQYMIQQDIDTFTPISMYSENIDDTSIKLLNNFKVSKGYPNLPIKININWSGKLVDNTGNLIDYNGVDKNVEAWFGISPPPQNAANKFTSIKNVIYGSPPGDPDKWQDQYNLMLDKTKICQGNNSKDPWCTNNKTLNFSEGATWSGLLFQKFFQESLNSSYINISMYQQFLNANQPCDYLNGGYGYTGCTPDNYHGDGWFSHGFPLLFPLIKQYIENKGKLRLIDGVYNSGNDPGFVNLWMPNQLSTLPVDQQKNIHIKWFNQSRDGKGNFDCSNSCGSNSCCRNHEKIYMSDKHILISSGHPSRGYYSDINGINNDVLFLNSLSLAKFFANTFKISWDKQSVTVNSQTSPQQKWWNSKWDNFTTPAY